MVPDPDRFTVGVGRAWGEAITWWRPSSWERLVWWVALAALLADLGLTQYGLNRGLTEANPLGAAALESLGIVGLGLLKTGALGIAVLCRQFVPERFGVMPPAVLACVWGAAALSNAGLILVTA